MKSLTVKNQTKKLGKAWVIRQTDFSYVVHADTEELAWLKIKNRSDIDKINRAPEWDGVEWSAKEALARGWQISCSWCDDTIEGDRCTQCDTKIFFRKKYVLCSKKCLEIMKSFDAK